MKNHDNPEAEFSDPYWWWDEVEEKEEKDEIWETNKYLEEWLTRSIREDFNAKRRFW